jgi:osmoprotectant transport system permease protein
VHIFGEVVAWFGAPEQWSGSGAIPTRIWEHLGYSIPAVLAAIIPAVMLGLYVGHTRRLEFLVSVSGLARALPSFGVLAFFFPISLQLGLGLSFWPTFIALFFLAVPPILTNTYVGVRQVDPEIVDAARGMGMTETGLVRKVRLPLAMPTIFAGIRTSAVSVLATATIGPYANLQTLGEPILTPQTYGFSGQLGAAVVVALMTLVADAGIGLLQQAVTPKGIKLAEQPGRKRRLALPTRRREAAT